MVTVPHFCPDVPYLEKNPVFFFYDDRFTKPTRFSADVVVDIDDVIDKKLAVTEALESQFYEGRRERATLDWSRTRTTPPPSPRARSKFATDSTTASPSTAKRFGLQLAEWYGAERSEKSEVCGGVRTLRIRPQPQPREG